MRPRGLPKRSCFCLGPGHGPLSLPSAAFSALFGSVWPHGTARLRGGLRRCDPSHGFGFGAGVDQWRPGHHRRLYGPVSRTRRSKLRDRHSRAAFGVHRLGLATMDLSKRRIRGIGWQVPRRAVQRYRGRNPRPTLGLQRHRRAAVGDPSWAVDRRRRQVPGCQWRQLGRRTDDADVDVQRSAEPTVSAAGGRRRRRRWRHRRDFDRRLHRSLP